MQCFDDATALAWIAGDLDDAARLEAAQHLDDCGACLELIAYGGDVATEARFDPAGRYDPQDELSSGGMGMVLIAHDRILGREVAVKVVVDPEAPALAARLAREMAITARLAHPAIVPIYDAGITGTGEPFFVMPRVRGRPLDEVVGQRTELSERIQLLPAVAGAIDAVAYAHERGVVHRDLKPQNLLVGERGEIVVLDWGLARASDLEDIADSVAASEHAGLEISPALADARTAAGQILGTLGYMAPEQAAGDEVDERADVYCLGGVLYHLLTGATPHAGRDGSRCERPEPVAERSADAPPELCAIVDRALAERPEDRYPSAGELAADLRRFTAGQLVRAHAYSPRQLVLRWLSRHRALVAVTAVAAAVSVAIGAVAISRTVAARRDAELARDRADHQRQSAEELIEFSLGELRGKLDEVGRLDILATLGDRVESYYEALPPRLGAGGASDRRRLSKAYGLLGDVRLTTGDLDAAAESFAAAARMAEAAWQRQGGVPALTTLARALYGVARTEQARRNHDAVVSAAERGLELAPRTSAPDELSSGFLVILARVAEQRSDGERARELLERALVYARAINVSEANRTERQRLTVVLDRLGSLARRRGEPAAALPYYTENLERAETLFRRFPDDLGNLANLVTTRLQLAEVQRVLGERDAAWTNMERAKSDAQELVSHDPSNLDWLTALNTAVNKLGHLAMARGDLAVAQRHLDESFELSRTLAARAPDDLGQQRNLGVAALNLAQLGQKAGDLPRAQARAAEAVAIFDGIVAGHSDRERHRRDLSIALLNLAVIAHAGGDPKAASDALARSLDIRRAFFAAGPSPSPQTRIYLAEALGVANDFTPSRAILDEARDVVRPLVGREGAGDYERSVVGRLLPEASR